MSPVIADKPERISLLNPVETATAMIMTRKLTAMEIIATLPLKRSLFAMKKDTFIGYFTAFNASRRPFANIFSFSEPYWTIIARYFFSALMF